MGEIRRPKRTLEKLAEVAEETNPFLAMTGVIDIIEDYLMYEEKVPAEFNPKNGEPVKFKWTSNGRIENWRVLLNYDKERYTSLKLDSVIPINQKVIDYLFMDMGLENNPFMINVERGHYFVGYRVDRYEIGAHNDSWIRTDRIIYFQKVNHLLTKEGSKEIKQK
jgi:hypothetical protein